MLVPVLWCQQSSPNEKEKVAIQRAKNVIVSSFDRSLPNVSLEYFLKYEGEGAPIKWIVNNCGDRTRNPGDIYKGSRICVEADFEFKPQILVTVLVSLGTFNKGLSGVPELTSVTIIDVDGTNRSVHHLGDLPMELHRPPPKLPRDLPPPAGALLSVPKLQECAVRFVTAEIMHRRTHRTLPT